MKKTINMTRGTGLLEGFLSKKRADKANELIPPSLRKGKVLDIGCGSYPYFLISTKFNEKYGIDPSLRISSLENIILSKLDISRSLLPFKDNFFDVIVMLAVFEHIEKDKLDLVLRETFKMLKKDGVLIITTPSPWSDKLLHQMAKVGLISEVEIHEHKSHYNMGKIILMIEKAGFKRENIKSGYFELGMNMWFTVVK